MTELEVQTLAALHPERYRAYKGRVIRLGQHIGSHTCEGCIFTEKENGTCPTDKQRIVLCIGHTESHLVWKFFDDQA